MSLICNNNNIVRTGLIIDISYIVNKYSHKFYIVWLQITV